MQITTNNLDSLESLIQSSFKEKNHELVTNYYETNELNFSNESLENVGKSYFSLGEYSKCISVFEGLLEKEKYSSDAMNSYVAHTFTAISLRNLNLKEQALFHYQIAYNSTSRGLSSKDVGIASRNLAFSYRSNQNYPRAISVMNEAILTHERNRDSLNLMKAYSSIGLSYYQLGILDSALTYSSKSYNYFKENPTGNWGWESTFWLANIERELKNINALKYYEETLELSGNDISNKILSLSGMGEALLDQGKDSSYFYLRQAYDLALESQFENELSEITLIITRYYTFQNLDLDSIPIFLLRSKEFITKRKDGIGWISTQINTSEFHKIQKNIKESLEAINIAIDSAKAFDLKNKLNDALTQKFKVLNHFGRYKEALEVKEEEIKVREELFNDRSEAVYQILRTQNEMDKQESTIANQQLEIDNNNLQILIMYISIALVISALVFIFWQYRTRSKYAQKLETMFLDSRHRYMNNLLLLKNWFNEGKTDKNDEIISFAQNRIDAISTVNRHLDRLSYNKDTIESKSFLEDISHNLLANREFTSEIENVPINMSVSGPLGMITNEIITNGLKYGEAPYAIRFHKNGGGYLLEIEDHGPGIADPEKQGTGSKVLRLLSRQLKGKLIYQNKADHSPDARGTLVSLNFKG